MKRILFIMSITLLQSCASMHSNRHKCVTGVVMGITDCKAESIKSFNPEFARCNVVLVTGENGMVYAPVRAGDSVELCEGTITSVEPGRFSDFNN